MARPAHTRSAGSTAACPAVDALLRWFHAQVAGGGAREVARGSVMRTAITLFERDLGVALNGASLAAHVAPGMGSPAGICSAGTWPEGQVVDGPATACDWAQMAPEALGELYEGTLGSGERHAGGVHFTRAEVIERVLGPTVVAPWLGWIDSGVAPDRLHARLLRYRVLDPACGAGNFLLAAYRALREIEAALRRRGACGPGTIDPAQCFGIDRDPQAAEVARLSLRIVHAQATGLVSMPEILVKDALFNAWPEVDVIVGNPPFLDARKLTVEAGRGYTERLRGAHPQVPGRADLCVYWFRRAHDSLINNSREDPVAGRAGLVGTKTIRENYSRIGGLDHIVASGHIVDAVASLAWPGAAAVDVAIVNWVKGAYDGPRMLQDADGVRREVAAITSALTAGVDVASARGLAVVTRTKLCFEGQQPGHAGFRIDARLRQVWAGRDPRISEVVHPYLNGASLLTARYLRAPVYVLDFAERTLADAAVHVDALAHVERTVLPAWQADARREGRERSSGEHQRRERTWWQLKRRRGELLTALAGLPRYIVCVRHTQRPIFEFLDSEIRPDSALTVFAFADDYSFGVLQSSVHWQWFTARCSSLARRFRYTSETVFDAFPWPQRASAADMRIVAEQARALRAVRAALVGEGGLRALYRRCDGDPGHALRAAHAALDAAVLRVYGFSGDESVLAALFELGRRVADDAAAIGPGGPAELVSGDCVAPW